MAPRPGIARPRDIDFSAVGKAGRRTGITLAPQRLDEYGLEEVSSLFSSPRKPSPLKNVIYPSGVTPPKALSTRRSVRASLPRSASPRKTGISGTARRSNGIDIRALSREPDRLESDDQENENGAPSSPSNRANHSARRYSEAAAKTPLRDITSRNTPNSRDKATWDKMIDDQEEIAVSIEDEYSPRPPSVVESEDVRYQTTIDDQGPVVGDDEYESAEQEHEAPAASEEPILPALDDEEVDQTFEPQPAFSPKAKANSRRKRKSDLEVPTSSPAAKRPRRENPEQVRAVSTISEEEEIDAQETVAESSKASSQPQKRPRGRPALKEKSTNVKTKPKYPKEVKGVIEKVRARPNPPKVLYILRRETPADDGVTHTRSGRVSFKPLAFWRNEQCVYGGSPSGAGLKDGARFPLNSVKEIIRTEEVVEPLARTKSKKRKGRTERSKSRTEDAEVSDSESDEERVDPDAEAWDTNIGTLRGPVQVWDSEAQAPIDEEEDIDIAYAPAAIQRSVINVKSGPGPAFKYAKLLGNKFMGVGLVELEPGGIKRPKNSRKMHMSFFVVKGRVTVSVGPAGGEETGSWSKFSIGKGGFWQVPRGNQYSIENQMEKSARIFFSQGCEVSAEEDD